jgi:hypothetical protein
MFMLWNILRPRVWQLRHQWTDAPLRNRILMVIGLLAIVGFVGFMFVLLIIGLFGSRGRGYLATLLPTSFFSMIFFTILQLGDTLHQLYLSPDLFWLNQAPLRKLDIYLAKLVECSLTLWLPFLFSLATLTALGIAQAAPFLFYPLSWLTLLALLLLATVTGMLVIMLVAQIIPPRRMREFFPALLALVSIGGVFLQRLLIPRSALNTNTLYIQGLTTSLQDPLQMGLVTVLSLVASGVWVALGYAVFSAVNERAINAIQIVQMPKMRTAPALQSAGTNNPLNLLARLFPSSQWNIMVKDWLTLRRDPQRFTNILLIPLMMILFMLPAVGWKDFSTSGYWLMLFYAALSGMNSGQSTALASFTQEARTFSFIYRSPVSMATVMAAKFWAAWIPNALLWTLVMSGGAFFLHLAFWQWGVLNGMILVCLTGTCFAMVGISARSTDLTTLSLHARLTGPMAWVALGVALVWNCLILGLTTSLIFFLGANTPLVMDFVSTFSNQPVPVWIPLAAVIFSLVGLVIMSIPIGLFWRSGLNRLKRWEQA